MSRHFCCRGLVWQCRAVIQLLLLTGVMLLVYLDFSMCVRCLLFGCVIMIKFQTPKCACREV